MPALPASTAFTDSAVTEGGFKTAISDQRGYLAGLLGADGTIATGQSTLKTLCGAANARSAGSYSLLATDRGKVIHVTGSGASAFTVPTTATADFGVGWACAIRNDCSSGDITLTRSSTDTIDGATSVVLSPGQSSILAITAAGKWVTIGKGATAATEATAGIVELATTAEAAAGTLTTHSVTPAGALEVRKAASFTATNATTGSSTMSITGIPSWARVIHLGVGSVSGNSLSAIAIDLGDAGGFETGKTLTGDIASAISSSGGLTLVNTTGNSWAYFGGFGDLPQNGIITISDTLTQLRLRLLAGVFDAGRITAYWQ
jgi:hypothetical protein